ncbi:hypothetical protein [Alteromonas sp. a30]|uniref:hypothetical protein n=1 Tax=Alteromonas sp. a30 TaxID=2730917 RepID=UPI0022814BC3|nr:hypothetical protein [Alteromonas sp. a30]MCY7295319.1 hypothetical protein [Alteromonas sp. a30]
MHIQSPERTFYCLFNPGKRTNELLNIKQDSSPKGFIKRFFEKALAFRNSLGERRKRATTGLRTSNSNLKVVTISCLYLKALINRAGTINGAITSYVPRGIEELVW